MGRPVAPAMAPAIAATQGGPSQQAAPADAKRTGSKLSLNKNRAANAAGGGAAGASASQVIRSYAYQGGGGA